MGSEDQAGGGAAVSRDAIERNAHAFGIGLHKKRMAAEGRQFIDFGRGIAHGGAEIAGRPLVQDDPVLGDAGCGP